MNDKLTYETAQAELQQLLAELQQGTVTIDELEEKVRRAKTLIVFCQERLRSVENALNDLLDGD